MKKTIFIIIAVLVLSLSLIYTVSAANYPQVDRSSFDQIHIKRVGNPNFEVVKDGDLVNFLLTNPQVYDKQIYTSFALYGWAGQLNLQIDTYGYSIDDGPFVPGNFTLITEDLSIIRQPQHGGPYATRFYIEVPIGNLAEGPHIVNALVKLSDGSIYNICDMAFTVTESEPLPTNIAYDGIFAWTNGAVDQTLLSGTNFPLWVDENPLVFSERQTTRVSVYGWVVPPEGEEVDSFVYSINGGPHIFQSTADEFPTALELKQAFGDSVRRFFIHVPTLDLTEGVYEITTSVKTTNNNYYEIYSYTVTITERALARAHIEALFKNYDFMPTLFYEGTFAPFGNRTSHLDPADYIFNKHDTMIINIYGWMQDGYTVTDIGYKVNDGPLVNDSNFKIAPEKTLIELAGPYAMRFNVGANVTNLGTGVQKVAAWATLSSGESLEITSFTFVLLDTDVSASFRGNQIRRTLVPRRLQNGDLNYEDMRQGLRFLFRTPDLTEYENDNGIVEIVNDGALVALSDNKLSFEDMDSSVQIQNGLIGINVEGTDYRSAYIYNIPEGRKDTIIYVRPYFEISVNGESIIVYGEIQAKSVTNVYENASGNENFTPAVIEWWNPANATPTPSPSPTPSPTPTPDPTLVGSANSFTVAGAFGNDMILQRDQEVAIYGTAPQSENGKYVVVEYKGVKGSGQVINGKWKAVFHEQFAASKALGNSLKVEGKAGTAIYFTNVLVGDVWYVGGQSNAELTFSTVTWQMYQSTVSQITVNTPIRLFDQKAHNLASFPSAIASPQDNPLTLYSWKTPSAVNVHNFSMLGIFFANRMVELNPDVPIGLINVSCGGATLSMLSSPTALAKYPAGMKTQTMPLDTITIGNGSIYNAFIHPFIDYGIRGMLFFQGESDSLQAYNYANALKDYVLDLRSLFDYELEFLNVQLSSYGYYAGGHPLTGIWDLVNNLRNVQAKIKIENMLSNYEVISSYDVGWQDGDPDGAHPYYKKPLGERLANIAAAKIYGIGTLNDAAGPVPSSVSFGTSKVEIDFNYTGSGLKTVGSAVVSGFEVRVGSTWQTALATIDGSKIVINRANVTAVRYGYPLRNINLANGNVYSSTDNPLICFEWIK